MPSEDAPHVPPLSTLPDPPSADADPAAHLADGVLRNVRMVLVSEGLPAEADRRLLRVVNDGIADLAGGITPHGAAYLRSEFNEAVPGWFASRAAMEEARAAELETAFGALGRALFAMRDGGDRDHRRITDGLDRVAAAGERSPSSRVVARLVQDVLSAVQEQKRSHERRIRAMSEQIQDLSERFEAKAKEAAEDRLTRLANRAAFDDHLDRLLRRASFSPLEFSVILVDIDHFKGVNDTFGHVEGDRVLRIVAECLAKVVLRRSDFLARYGGEEFAVVLQDCNGPGGGVVAERIRTAVEELRITSMGKPLQLTVSTGVAEGWHSDSPEALLRRADDALYLAKRTGRNRTVVAGDGAGRKIALPAELARRLKSRVEEEEQDPDQGSRRRYRRSA